MREKIYLNENWLFSPEFEESILEPVCNETLLTSVRLPHTVAETPFNYFDESIYQMVSAYRHELMVPDEWSGKKLLLTFEGAAHKAEVFVNGESVCIHESGYTAFTIDISKFVNYAETNIIVVKLDSRESLNQPPFGFVIDYMTYGGLYREVYLEVINPTFIDDVFIQTKQTDKETWSIDSEIKLNIADGDSGIQNCKIVQRLFTADESGKIIQELSQKKIDDNDNSLIFLSADVSNVFTWNLENPVLYILETSLYNGKNLLDSVSVRFGFRTAEFRSDGFYLNNEKIKIRGLNRHQSYPYVGYAMPGRVQADDADILKDELGLNAVRTSHYPQSQYFIDRCDELGLLVFTEIPGWQHIGDDVWQDIACQNVKEMVLQYRNHPSIILWGVRINESIDNDDFYTKTNKIAHQLDSSRSTSGVRYLERSSLLEDVYAFNDFSHTGQNDGTLTKKRVCPDNAKGYLVSEYNGHMFPTKIMDTERLRTEHSVRHANVIASYYKKEGISGGFGWCMFDYNTHRDFGSGDRICYHGVMDFFRNPKPAAMVYASQKEPSSASDIVADLSSEMEIGEYPAGNIGDIYAFTNADSVKLYKNNDFVKEFFPLKGKYEAMPHPPVLIDDYIGQLMETNEGFSTKKSEAVKELFAAVRKYGQSDLPLKYKLKMLKLMVRYHFTFDDGVRLYSEYVANWGGTVNTYRFDFIWNGEVVKTVNLRPMSEQRFVVNAKRTSLIEESSYDAVSVRFRMESENGRLLSFCNDIVSLEVSDNLEIIGPSQLPLRGGVGGTWVKTKKIDESKIEEAFLKLTSGEHEEVVKFTIERGVV
ncbi:MAG: glycoside hydrolase family 2 TIM barrel-domain containing protein [Spirochaetales bacterium]|nr:glycoside hydrolase family 2 TIM barrel-domain containing protein [Spirochaetales bacterium]